MYFDFLLYIRVYQNLACTYLLIREVVQSVAAIAIRLGIIVPNDVMKLVDEIKEEGQHIDRFNSTYPVDLYEPNPNASTGTLEYLVNEFKSMEAIQSDNARFPEGWMGDSVTQFTALLEEDDGDENEPR